MTPLTVAPDATWLMSAYDEYPPRSSVVLLAAGYAWEAVRTPQGLGLATAERLLADPDDRTLLGPVLHSRRSACLYWLIRPGSTADYPHGCQHLGVGNWIAAPCDRALHPDTVRWLHLPEPGILTSAAWLAAALHDTRHPTAGRDQMTHSDDAALIKAAQAAILPLDEHRPEKVSPLLWAEYVEIMSAAPYGKVTPASAARLEVIYSQAPEILGAGRDLDFTPRRFR